MDVPALETDVAVALSSSSISFNDPDSRIDQAIDCPIDSISDPASNGGLKADNATSILKSKSKKRRRKPSLSIKRIESIQTTDYESNEGIDSPDFEGKTKHESEINGLTKRKVVRDPDAPRPKKGRRPNKKPTLTPAQTALQKQTLAYEKLRTDYLTELNKLEIKWPEYRKQRIRAVTQHGQQLLQSLMEAIQSQNAIQQGLAIQQELEEVEAELDRLRNGYELKLLYQIKHVLEPMDTIKEEIVKDEIKEEGKTGLNTQPFSLSSSFQCAVFDIEKQAAAYKTGPFLQTFLQKFQKAPLSLWNQNGALNDISQIASTENCPEHGTRLVASVDDGTLSCTECGHANTDVDTSVEVPATEESLAARDNGLLQVIQLFQAPKKQEGIDQESSAHLTECVEYVIHKFHNSHIRIQDVFCKIYPYKVHTILKTNKALSTTFGPLCLQIASLINNIPIPRITDEEVAMIDRIRGMIREPLQALRPVATLFNRWFSFIKICQILAVVHSTDFLRFIPWVEKLTNPERLQKQVKYWQDISRYCGLPTISGQDMLSEETIAVFRTQYQIKL
ncbi:MAG: hypothetical protein Sylvanvirus1_79 [Sylvanvirus sp.]|uniref:Uncharacterized protein n=1 Tax=Sylvanvirus sp. TaxID=2487774 RepID=A0A3G5AK29_9VIRU|nr:MAG: hypothetical protein Sylvanvirus1_79 [Sylvanvirus sp.]